MCYCNYVIVVCLDYCSKRSTVFLLNIIRVIIYNRAALKVITSHFRLSKDRFISGDITADLVFIATVVFFNRGGGSKTAALHFLS